MTARLAGTVALHDQAFAAAAELGDRGVVLAFAFVMAHADPLFQVRVSPIHGLGLFAVRPLNANTRLGVYAGRRMSPEEVEVVDWDSRLTYLFGLSDGTVIDGAQGGNDLRHLNHSCSPNCEAIERCGEDGTVELDIVVLRNVSAGEELCIDYALMVDESQPLDAYPCMCNAAGCRGTMASAG